MDVCDGWENGRATEGAALQNKREICRPVVFCNSCAGAEAKKKLKGRGGGNGEPNLAYPLKGSMNRTIVERKKNLAQWRTRAPGVRGQA